MFGYIKNILKRKSLKDAAVRVGKRNKATYNFETAKVMGVIYPFNINMASVAGALKDISERYDIELVFMVYFPQEKLPEGIAENTPSQIFFSDNECNWFGKPKVAAINSFVNTKFNILVDLSSKEWFPLQYIAVASHADFKIGRMNGETNNPYDFVLAGNVNDEQFIKVLETYLYKIK
ncbi:MAG: hypothetical protein LBS43_06830 [Prevotellaceae bacterium]|jgi:hypothetical protein|nr:hypothetical protein [Prevotellaceae bacterium]